MATTNKITTSIETFQASYIVVGVRRPLIFSCSVASVVVSALLALWWFFG